MGHVRKRRWPHASRQGRCHARAEITLRQMAPTPDHDVGSMKTPIAAEKPGVPAHIAQAPGAFTRWGGYSTGALWDYPAALARFLQAREISFSLNLRARPAGLGPLPRLASASGHGPQRSRHTASSPRVLR